MYPHGEPQVSVIPGALAERMEGAIRPGHFRGVLTVVAKLFGIFQPDVAVFGQKDFQQAALIRRMALDLDLGVRVEVAPIVREPDGLAMSSRNVYLSAEERERALALSRGLETVPRPVRRGRAGRGGAPGLVVERPGGAGRGAGVRRSRRPADAGPRWRRPAPGTVLLVAARVGQDAADRQRGPGLIPGSLSRRRTAMLRTMCKSKIHRATVTGADLNYIGSITIDPVLMEAADLLEFEQVAVVNVNNGARFETYVIPGERGKGEICLNGAAARMVHPGDKVIVISYAQYDEAEMETYRPQFIFVDEQNRISRDALRAVGS